MNDSTFKQLVFDCAMELLYGQEELTNEQIGIKLLEYIKLHDESNEDKIYKVVDNRKNKTLFSGSLAHCNGYLKSLHEDDSTSDGLWIWCYIE